MSGTWVSDMQHFLGVEDPTLDVPAPARKMGDYLGRIVSAASSWYKDQPLESVILCRRRPGKRSCTGHIRLVRKKDDTILWQCSVCEDNGLIHGWKGTPWDLSAPRQVFEFLGLIPEDVYRLVAEIPDLPRPALRVIMRAAVEREDVLLTGTLEEIDSLKSVIGKAIQRAQGRRKELFGRLLRALDGTVDGGGRCPDDPVPGPREKISETLLVFAAPLLEIMGRDAPVSVVKNVLTTAVTVWNAMGLQPGQTENSYLDQARRIIATSIPQMMPMFEMLVERKKRYFADDLRAIGDFKVYRNSDGEIRVMAEARAPKSSRTLH